MLCCCPPDCLSPIKSRPLILFSDRQPALNRKVSSDRNRRPSRLTPDCRSLIQSRLLILFSDRRPALNRKVPSDRNRKPSRFTPDCDPLIPSQPSICFAIRRPSHTLAIPLIHSLPSIWSSDQRPALNRKGLNRKVSITYCCVTSLIAIL